jgi:mono/diheme cytochrome c family protein
MRSREPLAVAFVFAAALAYAAGSEPVAVSYAKDVEPLFIQECGKCHGADDPKKGLDLSLGRGYANLVGVASQEIPEIPRVKPGDLADSYLWQKLTHTSEKGKGMPRTLFSSKRLPQSQLDLIDRWIIQGAKP